MGVDPYIKDRNIHGIIRWDMDGGRSIYKRQTHTWNNQMGYVWGYIKRTDTYME